MRRFQCFDLPFTLRESHRDHDLIAFLFRASNPMVFDANDAS
jgi:hypothetical protein